jgi:hypothetical protein
MLLERLIVLAVAGSFCLGCKPAAPSPSPLVVEEKAFSVRFPPGWFRATFDAQTRQFVPAAGGSGPTSDYSNGSDFAALDGSFFHVEVDPLGHGYCADAQWTVRANGAVPEIVEEQALDRPLGDPAAVDEEGCYANSRSDTLGIATQFSAGGHSYFLMFGNKQHKRGNDLALYRGILATFRLK